MKANLHLLTSFDLGSPDGECQWTQNIFPPLNLLILCIPVCKCFCLIALFLSCWHYLFSAFQSVGAPGLLLCFSPADIAHSLLSSLWVPLLCCSVSPLLISLVLCFSGCKCLCFVALFLPCWHCLFSAFQLVSASALLLCFSPVDIACFLLSRMWVPLLCCSVSPLLTLPFLCSPGCECPRFVALFLPCWHCLFSAFQWVSASALLLCFYPADIACSLLSSW